METVIRVALVYVTILVGLRLLGKREFGQLTPLELVTLLLIPEIVSQSLIREDYSLTNALIGVMTLFLLVFVTSALNHRFRRFESVMLGEPTLLVQHGRFIESALNRSRISPQEIFAEMRKAGIDRLARVKWAVLETDGKISVIPESSEAQRSSST